MDVARAAGLPEASLAEGSEAPEMRRRREAGARKSEGSGSVNLISMMDILTVLLLFLLKSYVAAARSWCPARRDRAAELERGRPSRRSRWWWRSIGDEILIRQRARRDACRALVSSGSRSHRSPRILQAVQQQQDEIARLRGAEPAQHSIADDPGGPRTSSSAILQKVHVHARQNGYENISLAVLQKS
jgi:hypothetical protein